MPGLPAFGESVIESRTATESREIVRRRQYEKEQQE